MWGCDSGLRCVPRAKRTTGAEYFEFFGYWDPALVVTGLFYGGLLGSIVGPLAYPFLVRKIGFQKAILPAFLGAIVGGFLGAVVGPPFAAVTGICGFFRALWAKVRVAATHVSASP